MATHEHLPAEIVGELLKHVSRRDIANLEQTCKSMYAKVKTNPVKIDIDHKRLEVLAGQVKDAHDEVLALLGKTLKLVKGEPFFDARARTMLRELTKVCQEYDAAVREGIHLHDALVKVARDPAAKPMSSSIAKFELAFRALRKRIPELKAAVKKLID